MQYEELSDEAIQAARRRRQREVERRAWGVPGGRSGASLLAGWEAARRRVCARPAVLTRLYRCRCCCRDMAPLDLESIELPENHPFAVRKSLAPGQHAEMWHAVRFGLTRRFAAFGFGWLAA